MIRTSTIFSFFLCIILGSTLFHTKYHVANLESSLKDVHQDIDKTQESLHLLRAEWTFLNEPQRLQALAEKHLNLRPTDPVQLVAQTKDGSLKRNTAKPNLKTTLAAYRRLD